VFNIAVDEGAVPSLFQSSAISGIRTSNKESCYGMIIGTIGPSHNWSSKSWTKTARRDMGPLCQLTG